MRGIPFRWTLADHLFAYPATLACSAPPSKGWAMRCTVLGFTSNLAAVLRTLMPPARAALIRSASLSAIGGRPSRLPFSRCASPRASGVVVFSSVKVAINRTEIANEHGFEAFGVEIPPQLLALADEGAGGRVESLALGTVTASPVGR